MNASVSLSLDSSAFTEGMNKAEGHAKSFGGRLKGLLGGGAKSPWQDFVGSNELKGQLDKSGRDVETFGKKFESLFKRDPARRASIAFEQLAENLSSGDIPGAITGFAAKTGGIGLAASIGVGVAVGIFKKFTDDLIAARTASRELQSEVSKPISVTGGLGVAGINQEIEKTSKLIETMTAKTSGFTGRFFESLKSGGFAGGLKTLVTGGRLGGQPEAAKDVGAGFAGLNQLLKARADTEDQIAGIKEKQLRLSDEDAAIAAISLDTDQKKKEILNESLDKRNALSDTLKSDEDTRRLGLGLGLNKDVRKKYEEELALINANDAQRIKGAQKIGDLSTEALKAIKLEKADVLSLTASDTARASIAANLTGELQKQQHALERIAQIDNELKKPGQSFVKRAGLVTEREQQQAIADRAAAQEAIDQRSSRTRLANAGLNYPGSPLTPSERAGTAQLGEFKDLEEELRGPHTPERGRELAASLAERGANIQNLRLGSYRNFAPESVANELQRFSDIESANALKRTGGLTDLHKTPEGVFGTDVLTGQFRKFLGNQGSPMGENISPQDAEKELTEKLGFNPNAPHSVVDVLRGTKPWGPPASPIPIGQPFPEDFSQRSNRGEYDPYKTHGDMGHWVQPITEAQMRNIMSQYWD